MVFGRGTLEGLATHADGDGSDPGHRRLEGLSELFLRPGVPGFIRSDSGPEFVAGHVWRWIATVGAKTAYIEPGSPWENGYVESFNARFRTNCSTGRSSRHCEKPRS